MKNSKILIPETLKQKYLMQIHHGHQGIEACREKAREFVFWININKDIDELVQKCSLCQSKNWAIKHRTSSPHYPPSNGLAESMVKVSERLIGKAVRQDLP